MTQREGMIRVWTALGMTRQQIRKGLRDQARIHPGTLDQPIPACAPSLDELVAQCRAIQKMTPAEKSVLKAVVDFYDRELAKGN